MQYHLFTEYYYMMLSLMVDFYSAFISQGIITAAFILFIGLILAVELGKFAKKAILKTGIDKRLEKLGVKSYLKKGNIKFSIAGTVEWLVKWFIALFALTAAVDSLNLPQSKASEFLGSALNYIPNLFGALVILTIGIVIAQLVYEAVEGIAKASGVRIYHLAAISAKSVIVIIAVLVAIDQVGIKTEIISIFAGGLSLMIAIAGGLAFGLGGQYYARELIDELKDKFRQ